MNKMLSFAVIILIVVLAGCTTQSKPFSNNQSSVSNSTLVPSGNLTESYINDIGKTYNSIKQEHPNVEFKRVGIIDAAGECLSVRDSKFSYFFFGAQDGPSLKDICGKYGNELKCSGIASTVGDMFPDTKDQMSIETFFKSIGVDNYTYYDDEVGPAMGWIEFQYHNMDAYLSTVDNEFSYDNFKKVTTIKHSYTIVIINDKIENDNFTIQQSNIENS